MGLCLGKQQCPPPPSRWSELPPELGGLILSRLLSHADRASFRAACRQWRLAAQHHASSPPLPWIRLDDEVTFRSLSSGKLRRLVVAPPLPPDDDRRRGPLRPSDGGSLLLCRPDSDGRRLVPCRAFDDRRLLPWRLLNPFTGAAVDVPPVRQYSSDDAASPAWSVPRKTVVCSSSPEPLVIAAIFNSGNLGFYRPSPGESSWAISRAAPFPGGEVWYDDIAFHRGKLYALSCFMELFAYDVHDSAAAVAAAEHVAMARPPPATSGREKFHFNRPYLVASRDRSRLLMVRWTVLDRSDDHAAAGEVRDGDAVLGMRVFEADFKRSRWTELEKDGLDGETLFVSGRCCRAVRLPTTSTGGDRRFQGDRIYFPGADLPGRFDGGGGRAMKRGSSSKSSYGFYDMRSGRITMVFLKRRRRAPASMYNSEWLFPC